LRLQAHDFNNLRIFLEKPVFTAVYMPLEVKRTIYTLDPMIYSVWPDPGRPQWQAGAFHCHETIRTQ